MSDPTAADYYVRLGADPKSDTQEITKAAREAQKQHHPDHNSDPDSRKQFQRVREAAECLTDSEERAAYDVFYKRFGPENAAKAFERWTAFGRVRPPRSYSPGFSSKSKKSNQTGDRRGRSSSNKKSKKDRKKRSSETEEEKKTDGNTQSQTSKEASKNKDQRNTKTEGSSNSTADTSESGSASASHKNTARKSESSTENKNTSGRTHSNFGYRQEYERRGYEAPYWASLWAWPKVELGQIGHEIVALLTIGLTAGIGLILTTILAFVLVFSIYIIGPVVAVLEFGLRSAGIIRFEAFTITEIGLTWLLEVAVYVGVIFVVAFLFALLFDRDWEAHLGNRLGFPRLILILPISILFVGSRTFQEELASNMTPVIEPITGFLIIGAAWPALHRSIRLLLEAAPNHSGESILDTVGSILFFIGSSCFLLAAYLLGGRWMLGSLSEALEYSFLMRHLSPNLLLELGLVIAGISALFGVVSVIINNIPRY